MSDTLEALLMTWCDTARNHPRHDLATPFYSSACGGIRCYSDGKRMAWVPVPGCMIPPERRTGRVVPGIGAYVEIPARYLSVGLQPFSELPPLDLESWQPRSPVQFGGAWYDPAYVADAAKLPGAMWKPHKTLDRDGRPVDTLLVVFSGGRAIVMSMEAP